MHGRNEGIGAREELTVRLGAMQKRITKVPSEGKIVEKKRVCYIANGAPVGEFLNFSFAFNA